MCIRDRARPNPPAVSAPPASAPRLINVRRSTRSISGRLPSYSRLVCVPRRVIASETNVDIGMRYEFWSAVTASGSPPGGSVLKQLIGQLAQSLASPLERLLALAGRGV